MAQTPALIDHLAKAQIIVSLGATSLFAASSLMIHDRLEVNELIVIFSATWMMYMGHRVIGLRIRPQVRSTERFAYIIDHKTVLLVMAGAAMVSLLFFGPSFVLDRNIGTLIFSLSVAGGYSIPILAGKRLRDLPYIKIILIGLIWASTTVALSYRHGEVLQSWHYHLIIERVLFIIAITIPFDIRDLRIDREQDLKTLATVLGAWSAKILAIILLGICTLLLLWIKSCGVAQGYITSWHLMHIMAGFLIIRSSVDREEAYYSGAIDSTMLIPGIYVLSSILVI